MLTDAAAADMRGCGSQTPVPNTFRTPQSDSGQPASLIGADEKRAPKAR